MSLSVEVSPALMSLVRALVGAGWIVHTSVQTRRGAREVVFTTRPGDRGAPGGAIRVGATTNKVLSGQLYPGGTDGHHITHTATALPAALDELIRIKALRQHRDALLHTVQDGALVRYHGSITERHGIWKVRGLLRYGPYLGRFVLENPDDPGETLVPSSTRSFTVIR